MLYERRVLFGGIILAFVLAGVAFHMLVSPRYTATAEAMIDFRRLESVNREDAVYNFRLSDAAMENQIALIKSDAVIAAAVDSLDLSQAKEFNTDGWLSAVFGSGEEKTPAVIRQERMDKLKSMISPVRVDLSYMIEVSATSRDPALSAALANAVVNAYSNDQLKARKEVADAVNDWFEQRAEALQQKVTDAERATIDYRIKNQIMSADGKFIDESQVEDLSLRLVAAKERRIKALALLERVNAILAENRSVSSNLGESSGIGQELTNPVIVGLLARYHEISLTMQNNMTRYGAGHESVVKAQQDLLEIDRSIADEFRRLAESLKSSAEIAENEEKQLDGMLADVSQAMMNGQKLRVEMAILSGTANSLKVLRDNFLQSFISSTQMQSLPVTEIRVVTLAEPPRAASFPVLKKVLGFALGAGLLAGLSTVLAFEILPQSLRKRIQLETAVGRRCLGFVGNITRGGAGRLQNRRPWEAEYNREVFRSILMDIQEATSASPVAPVVALTGVRGDEGATTIAMELAILAGRSGKRVLLIDGDLRARTLTSRHNVAHERGLLEVLAGAPFVNCVQASASENVYILPASTAGLEAHGRQLMAGREMRDFCEMAQQRFDLVLIDLPPLALVRDARVIADVVTTYLLVVEWNRTTGTAVVDALAQNPEVERKLAGVVCNKTDLGKRDRLGDESLAAMINFYRSNPLPTPSAETVEASGPERGIRELKLIRK